MKTASTSSSEGLAGVVTASHYASGAMKSCMLNAENRIETPAGELVPQYRTAEFGERQKKHRSSLDFHENGLVKSVALDRQSPVKTPVGVVMAELVTFYEDGAVNRVFPLNGQIDGFWSEQHEREMAETLEFELPVGRVSAKIISLHFYPDGALKTLTFWPGERVTVETPLGPVLARAGLSLYENGALRSVEPSRPVELPTPIGLVRAFDPEIIGMHADQNSIQFTSAGELASIKTIHTGVQVTGEDGVPRLIEPYEAASFTDPTQLRTVPMQLDFEPGAVTITAQAKETFATDEFRFVTFDRERVLRESCGGCSGGDGCCGGGCGDEGCCGGA